MMKKGMCLLAGCLAVVWLLNGCGQSGNGTETADTSAETTAEKETGTTTGTAVETTVETTAETTVETIVETTVETQEEPSAEELKEPSLLWWELYNPNGIDTLTAAISNPNDVPVDVSYDVVYLKDGAEVVRCEGFANFSIRPGDWDIVWANYDIPKAEDVDEVKLENITVTESAYPPVKGSYEYAGTTDGEAFFEFTFESAPSLANITFLLYSDKNGNGQFDKGEIVVTVTDSLTEQKGTVSFDTVGYEYTDYEVFYNAY